jgi:hypothetical protein
MDHLVSEMVRHYHEARPHQAKDKDPLVQAPAVGNPKNGRRKANEPPPDVLPVTQIECRRGSVDC